jgi:peptidyl-prolyl cis-trans isomerase D
MREYFRGLKFILIIIVVAFVGTSVVYFVTSLGNAPNRPSVVATVNGEEIPVERFRRAQASLISRIEQTYQQRLTPELIDRLGINQQAINELINDAVIVQAAAHEGIKVSDEELRSRIQEMREFQEDGRFSRERYLSLLRQVRIDPGDFESEIRRQLVRLKVDGLIKGGVKVSEPELRDAYATRRERVRAAWASIDATPLMAKVTVADQDIEPYLAAHRAQFTRPERRRVQYVVIPPQPRPQDVSDVDAEAYYKEHASEYEQPRRVHVAHILVRVPPVGGSEAENKAKAKIEDVLRRARAGEDFGKLAAEVSEDTANASHGGDVGFVGPGELVPQFEQAAFALKKGEISPSPVRTPFGYHAIKVLDVREASRTPLKDVQAAIKQKLAAERADTAARAKADEVRPQLISAKDFPAEAGKLGLESREAAVARTEPLPGIGRDAKVEETVFSLAVGGVSTSVKSAAGYAIVKVVEQIPSGVPPLAEIKDKVIEAIKKERADALAMDRAKALVASLGKGGDFAATAKDEGFATGETALFSRDEPPKDRLPGGVMMAALGTPVGQVSEPVRDATSVYVVKTLERQPADPQGFQAQRAQLEQQLLRQKQSQAWESWLQSQRLAAKIDVTAQASASPR